MSPEEQDSIYSQNDRGEGHAHMGPRSEERERGRL